jgi:nitrate reductase NapAB chaperone NapD
MIASVVATLNVDNRGMQRVTDEISMLRNVEIGEIAINSLRIPIAIDSPDPESLEITTRQLQAISDVAFVDVVFVHFEEESEKAVAQSSQRTQEQ